MPMLMKAIRSRNFSKLVLMKSPSEPCALVNLGRDALGIGLEPDAFHGLNYLTEAMRHAKIPLFFNGRSLNKQNGN